MARKETTEHLPFPQPPGYSLHPKSSRSLSYPHSLGYPTHPQLGYPRSDGIDQNNIHNNVQASVFMVQPSQVQPVCLADKAYPNFSGAIILSCFTIWCCGWLFGLIAFILAMVGQSSASNGDKASAKSLLISSYVFSAIGIVSGIIVIIVFVVMSFRVDVRANTKGWIY